MNKNNFERRALQACVAAACLVPVLAGAAGVWLGMRLVDPFEVLGAENVPVDSHFRYMSGLLLGVGVAFLSTLPRIEKRRSRFQILTFVVVMGGLARAFGFMLAGWPGWPMMLGLGMELVVTPLLCLWQGRISKLAGYKHGLRLSPQVRAGFARVLVRRRAA